MLDVRHALRLTRTSGRAERVLRDSGTAIASRLAARASRFRRMCMQLRRPRTAFAAAQQRRQKAPPASYCGLDDPQYSTLDLELKRSWDGWIDWMHPFRGISGGGNAGTGGCCAFATREPPLATPAAVLLRKRGMGMNSDPFALSACAGAAIATGVDCRCHCFK